MTLEHILELIPNHISGHLSTCVKNKPEVRCFQLQFIKDNKFYFVTSRTKDVYAQIVNNPYIAFFCSTDQHFFRIVGKLHPIVSDTELMDIFNRLDNDAKTLYNSIHDNGFTAFYLEHGSLKFSDGFIQFQTFNF